ncbi:phytoene desaturase family protein [Caulobacter mirabilis]|uniref:Amine oxidase domain-containing protein n=1 Tax=Caulobacter mirabilis TaxID=69666 RepID=A0A2D2AY01_9CAUL|nr:FAD-dependent oxidoreductase [Caulobacter mirabilis]ATQ42862.1 hypothetical protein CSW64_10785 [Caulobacter mirabilis]
MKHAEVAVVGGGIAGLIAAVALARRGLRPTLFETAHEFGGRAQTRVVDGFHFNQGPHALYIGGAFHAALSAFGLAAPGRRLSLANALALWEAGDHPLPTGLVRGQAAPPLSAADADDLAEAFAAVAAGAGEAGTPLRAFTGTLSPAVRMVVEAFVRLSTYAHAPEDIDAKAALDQQRLSFSGVIYVDGGWRALVSQLVDAATTAGVRLRAEHRVGAIRREGRTWQVDLADGATEAFEAVILAASPAAASELVEGAQTVVAAARATRPVRTMGLDLGLAGVAPGPEYALGMDVPLYMSLHSAVADLAPPGGGLLHLGRYLAPDEAPDAGHIKALEQLADRLQPGWRDRLVHRQRLVGITVAHDLPHWRSGGRRAPVVVPDAPGLFLAGDWVGDEGLLSDASAASAVVAAREAAAFLSGVPA